MKSCLKLFTVRAAIKHCCYYRKSFLKLNSKTAVCMSSFGVLIISNLRAPPQIELLLIESRSLSLSIYGTFLLSSEQLGVVLLCNIIVLVLCVALSFCTSCVICMHLLHALVRKNGYAYYHK